MSNLIPLTSTEDGTQAVMGRDLHHFLEVKTRYNDWFNNMLQYGFSAGQDFYSFSSKTSTAGGRPRTDHILTMDMAKEVSMIQRSEKGKQARQYFIECEKRANKPLTRKEVLTMALEAEERAERERERAKALEAPARSWTTLAGAGGDFSVTEAAKTLSRDENISIGRDRLFQFMKSIGWIFRTKGHRAHWEAYQAKAVDTGRLVHKLSRPFLNERTGMFEQPSPTIRITPKGLHELHALLGGTGEVEALK